MIHTPLRPLGSGGVRNSNRRNFLKQMGQVFGVYRLTHPGEAAPAAESVTQSLRTDPDMRNHQTMGKNINLSVEFGQSLGMTAENLRTLRVHHKVDRRLQLPMQDGSSSCCIKLQRRC